MITSFPSWNLENSILIQKFDKFGDDGVFSDFDETEEKSEEDGVDYDQVF